MKLKGLLAALMMLQVTAANALIVSVNGYDEIPEEGLKITVTEAEEDLLTEEMVMKLQGNLLTSNPLTVTITRSAAGLLDEFCCADECTAGNGETEEVLTFNPSGVANWYIHYTPEEESRVTVRYVFNDGEESRTLTVQYAYGIEPLPASFPKKNLIEEFTGQDCGYCPYGMDCIHEFMANEDRWVLILHHYGYQADHFSVAGSKTITNSLNVSGAPSVAINRAKMRTSDGNKIVQHPGYLPSSSKSQFDTLTYASLAIVPSYDAASRELQVTLSGDICEGSHPRLFMTVLLKESGMIDYQADYYNTYEGWEEFRHANAVRVFLSGAKGDTLQVDANGHYTATYTTTLNEARVAENMSVVAFLSESFKPVIQAEQCPVVNGTEGGLDILHGGLKAAEVPEYYPEYNATDGPGDLTGNASEQMKNAQVYWETFTGGAYGLIQAYNLSSTHQINGTSCVPFAMIYVFVKRTDMRLYTGTYEFNTSMNPGTAYAGFRDDETFTIDGSEFYFTSLSYLRQGYLVPSAEWLIADGTLTITKKGWSVDGHARNGAPIHFKGDGIITDGGYENDPDDEAVDQTEIVEAPRKSLLNGQLIIRRGAKTFSVTGVEMQ